MLRLIKILLKWEVFNTKGNNYRLIVDIEYRFKIVFRVWFGTHKEYDKIDAKTVSFKNYKIIKTKQEYDEACKRIYNLIEQIPWNTLRISGKWE